MRLLRSDIIISPAPDGPGCKLFDEHAGKTYEFGEVEYFLIQQFQKPYHIDDVITQCNKCFDQKLNPQDADEFLDLLAEWNLLLKSDSAKELPEDDFTDVEDVYEEDIDFESDQQQELRIPNRWHLFNPQNLFDSLNRLIYPVRKLIWLTPLIFAFGLMTAVKNFDVFLTGMKEAQATFGIIGRLLFASVTINLMSQIARALVARYYHIPTPSFGISLMMMPKFDVQIKIAGEVSRTIRIWLSLMPPIMSLLLFTFATVLWAVTLSSGSFLASIGEEVAIVATLGFILMTQPFFGNGVALWSALLDIPNLRQRTKLALNGLFSSQPDVIKKHTKHRIGFALYGLLSFAVIATMVGFIASLLFNNLERQFQGAGVALFLFMAAYLAWFIRQRKKEIRHSQQEQHDHQTSQNGSSNSNSTHSLSEKIKGLYAGGVDWNRRLRQGALLMSLGIVMILPYHYETSGEAEVFPIAKASISAETSGVIEHIYFRSGDFVNAGDKLASIANYKQIKDVKSTEATILSKRFDIQQLVTTPSAEDIQVSKSQLKTAELQYKYSKEDLERQTRLYKKGIISLDDYEALKNDAELKRQQKKEAKLNLEALLRMINPNQIDSLKAQLKSLEHDEKYYKEVLRRTYLTSPISGRITTEELQYKLNSYIDTGKEFAEIEDTRTVSVRIAIPETDIGEANLGAAVALKLWAYPNMTFSGIVDEVDPSTASEEKDYGRVIYVTSNIDNPDGLLISGLTGHAKVTGEKTFFILAFSRAFMRFLRIEVWSWIP